MIRLLFLVVVVVVLVIAILRAIGRGGLLFEIRVTGTSISHRGRVPGWAWSDVLEFLRREGLPSGCSVRGYPGDGRLRLEFGGPIDAGTCQKIRNFIYLKS